MMTVEILQLMYQKGLNQLDTYDFFHYVANQSVFLKIKDVASDAQILAAEGFKLSACLGED